MARSILRLSQASMTGFKGFLSARHKDHSTKRAPVHIVTMMKVMIVICDRDFRAAVLVLSFVIRSALVPFESRGQVTPPR